MARGVHAVRLTFATITVICMCVYIVSVSMWWCAVRRGVLGNSDKKVAHDPIFNVERIACRSTTGKYMGIFPWIRRKLVEDALIPSGFDNTQHKHPGVIPYKHSWAKSSSLYPSFPFLHAAFTLVAGFYSLLQMVLKISAWTWDSGPLVWAAHLAQCSGVTDTVFPEVFCS
jgi:hypothetical protein